MLSVSTYCGSTAPLGLPLDQLGKGKIELSKKDISASQYTASLCRANFIMPS